MVFALVNFWRRERRISPSGDLSNRVKNDMNSIEIDFVSHCIELMRCPFSLLSLDIDCEYMVLVGRRDSVWWEGDVEADGRRLIIELVLKVLWQ